MAYFDQEPFDVRCEWSMAAVQHIAPGDAIVIVDVLSFSTTVDIATSRGAAVLPYAWKDASAAEYASKHAATLAGRRGGDGLTLSPASLVNAPAGTRLVIPSQNGSNLAFAAKAKGTVVIAGCLRNASAVAAWLNRSAKKITLVPAGERWPDDSLRPAVEDLVGAGAIIKHLSGQLSPEAHAAVAAFDEARDQLRDRLLQCASGRELVEQNYGRDVELAAELDVSDGVPILTEDAFVATR